MFELTLLKLTALAVGSLVVASVLVVYVFLPFGEWLHNKLFPGPHSEPCDQQDTGACAPVVNPFGVPYGCAPAPRPDNESHPLHNRVALLEEIVYDRHVTVSLEDLVTLKDAPKLLRELSYTLHSFQPDDRTPGKQEQLIRYALALERVQAALGLRVK